MNKKLLIILIGITTIIIFYFLFTKNDSLNFDVSTNEGYILLKEGRVYFAANQDIKTEDIEIYIKEQIKKEHPTDTVLHFKGTYEQLKNGQKIKIWYTEILESYPEQIPVLKYKVLEK
ncbi:MULTISPECIES: DUF3221 domain-containing protein [Bacillus cereus group]|uniref:DUF3221 domain-containing protein n=1 Tax=Bacillus cereus group TaxID=86661 RepID=UPI00123C4DC5|nr:DUF3221 domain-containing protein [Bacillus cereus]KAA6455676.1 DUF3221 domain-containing protein [Bacillus cereus]KAB2417797.1 DUF3221 domain-containing protein [Bacillus cereus]KAB2437770.1 DUF3221 domain-containing protein [Bacillus cereus]KAB2469859.1 DUF3221 domain-containing protein [Bacillus cereus]